MYSGANDDTKQLTGSKYAVKFEPVDQKGSLLNECLTLRKLCMHNKKVLRRTPSYYLHNTNNGRRYVIMDYLESQVDDYIASFKAGDERDAAIQRVALEMFEAVQEMHQAGETIHRDIKPENFMMHRGETFIIDFGLATEYKKDGQHIPVEKNLGLQGTFRYASLWTHEGIVQSRRDDIQVLGFSIMKLLQENPKAELWPALKPNQGMSVSELNVQFYTEKKNFVAQEHVSGRFDFIHRFIKETINLQFD